MRVTRLLLAASLIPALAFNAAEARKKPKLTPAAPANYVVPPLTADNTWNLMLTTGGPVVIQLRPDKAPKSVERIKVLTQRGFYNGLTFHRVIEGFMAQGGDPKGTGEGGSDLPNLPAEFNDMPHVRGELAMARAQQPDSANSQFYIMLSPNLTLDRNYTTLGRVVSGMQYVDALERGEPPANPSRIVQAWVGATDQRPAAPALPPAPIATAPLPPSSAAPSAGADAGTPPKN